VANSSERNVATHCAHEHIFVSDNRAAERGTRVVMWITAVMMVVEIAAGYGFNSMALLADGWHMSSHTIAIGLSTLAYAMARRYARDSRFAFGTWKIEILGGFTSALFLLGVAVMMVVGSVERLYAPQPIQYLEAVIIAVIGLVVNLVCALILGNAHDHGHAHNERDHHAHDHHGHDHHQDAQADHAEHSHAVSSAHHHDLNLKSAYVHVIADAATSVLAVIALVGGWIYGWSWLDPVMGIAGAIVVVVWAKGLLKETAKILLDREMDHPVVDEIREVVAAHSDLNNLTLVDLHVWRIGRAAYTCALSLTTNDSQLTPRMVREWLAVHEEIVHVTVEIHQQ